MTAKTNPFWVNLLPAPWQKMLSGRHHLFALLHNSGWLLFEKFVRLSLALLVSAWVARYLGPSKYGELAYALALIGFFIVITNLGIEGIVVRDISKDESSAPQILGTAFILRLATGIICWFIAVGGIAASGDFHSTWLTALAGGSLIFQAADTVDLWFQSKSQSKRTVIAKLISYVIASSIKVVLILCHAPVEAFAAVFTLDALIAAAGLYIAYKRFPAGGLWKSSATLGKQLLKESWPYILSGLAIHIYVRIDQIMIKNMLSSKEVGVFAVAVSFSQIWNFIPITLATSFAPFVARKKAENHVAYMSTLLKIFRLFLVTSIIISLLIAALSGPIIYFLYGTKYSSSANILAIHIFSSIFVTLGVGQYLWLLNEKKSHIMLWKTIIGATVSVGGNFIAIPLYGIHGAAVVAVIAEACASFLCNLWLAPKIFLMQLGIKTKY